MARNSGFVVVLAILITAIAAVPAAHAAEVYNYRVHDGGAKIVERYRLCISGPPGYEVRVRDRTRVEQRDGSDAHVYDSIRWFERGCHVVRNTFPDELAYTGTYFARLRLRIGTTGQVIYSRWRAFNSY